MLRNRAEIFATVWFMNLWKVIPAFLSLKGIRRNLKRLKGVMTADLGTADSSRGTCR